MSGSFENNSELKALESQLQSISLPEANVDRDEVLYQAGWAAGQAALLRNRISENSLMSRWGWPSLSAACAVAAMLFASLWFWDFSSRNGGGSLANHVASVSPEDSEGSESVDSEQTPPMEFNLSSFPNPFLLMESGDHLSSSSLIARAQVGMSAKVLRVRNAVVPAPERPKSQRELLNEWMVD